MIYPFYNLVKETSNSKREVTYTKKELEDYLLLDSDLYGEYKTLKLEDIGAITVGHLLDSVAEELEVEEGTYIGVAVGTAEDMEEQYGIPVNKKHPRNILYSTMLGRINIPDLVDTEDELLSMLAVGVDIEPVKRNSVLHLPMKTELLSFIDKSIVEDKMEETLMRYKELSTPEEKMKHYLRLGDILDNGNEILYCPIMDKEVLILEKDGAIIDQ